MDDEVKKRLNILQKMVDDVLKLFEYEIADSATIYRVRFYIYSVLHKAQAEGLINCELPLVDINDEYEKRHIIERMKELEDLDINCKTSNTLDGWNDIQREYWILFQRLKAIDYYNERRDPTKMEVSFKQPTTFEIWEFK